jgi:hypothetical protein
LRERLQIGVLVIVLIFLIAFVFAILGRGEYEPPTSGEGSAYSVPQVALLEPQVAGLI